MKKITRHFSSLDELINEAKKPNPLREKFRNRSDEWFNNYSFADAVAYMRTSTKSPELTKAGKIADKIDAELPQTSAVSWESNVMGAYPVVAEYLAGMPENMRSMEHVCSNNAPIRIFANHSVVWNATAQDIANKCATVVALAQYLQRFRPVEVVLFDCTWMEKDRVLLTTTAPLSNPVSLVQLATALAQQSIRHVSFSAKHAASNAQYRNKMYNAEQQTLMKRHEVKEAVGCTESDIFVGAYFGIQENPVDYINKILKDIDIM